MHLILLAWFFVAVMLAITAESLIGALTAFLMWGVLPIGLIAYLFGGRRRPKKPGE